MKQRIPIWAAPMVMAIAGLACSLSPFGSSTAPAAATLEQLYTAAALTVQASSSQAASATAAVTSTYPFPTFPTVASSHTARPAVVCDAASFVTDVSIADGTSIDAGQDFTKTWRIQNVGTCSWTPEYALVFVGGDRMKGPMSVGLPGNVNPGRSVDLSVSMIAPDSNGQYQGFWKLRNTAGVLFGIGPQAQGPFWVEIRVAGPAYTAYDFTASYCDAAWQNNNRDLPCPGSEGDSKGYVIRLDHPVMEDGKNADQPGLLTVPKDVYAGLITGKYPQIKIRDGDHFQSFVSCARNAHSCNVIFRLEYQIGAGEIRTLGHWNEAYEGKYYSVNIDLSSLAGQNVKFMFTVSANGSSDDDRALWIAPRVTRRGTPPATETPTPTSTPTSSPTTTYTPTPSPTFTPTPTATPTGTSTATSTP